MTSPLSLNDSEKYRSAGFLFPTRVMSELEASDLLAEIEYVEEHQLESIGGNLEHKPHLLLTALNKLVRNTKLLDTVEGLIGPNILCWGGSFFSKEANDPAFVSWHQDATYWGLSGDEVLTAWVALSPATVESGAMRAIEGSHLQTKAKHVETYNKDNLLSRGQEAQGDFNPDLMVDMVLQPGEVSFHHINLMHSSEPNRSNKRRVGYAIRYISTSVKSHFEGDSAMLVRGIDKHNNFLPEESPKNDFSELGIRNYIDANTRHKELLFQRSQE